jgi:hypothetical protein
MKAIIIAICFFSACATSAQLPNKQNTGIGTTILLGQGYNNYTYPDSLRFQMDTIPCIMLVCDTSRRMFIYKTGTVSIGQDQNTSIGVHTGDTIVKNNPYGGYRLGTKDSSNDFTVKWGEDTSYTPPFADLWWQFGYLVRLHIPVNPGDYFIAGRGDLYVYQSMQPLPRTTGYLDINKKPLRKGMVVWLTKETQ